MKIFNTLALFTLCTFQALFCSEDRTSGFGSPCPSPTREFGLQSLLTVKSPGASGLGLREEVTSPSENMGQLTLAANAAFEKEKHEAHAAPQVQAAPVVAAQLLAATPVNIAAAHAAAPSVQSLLVAAAKPDAKQKAEGLPDSPAGTSQQQKAAVLIPMWVAKMATLQMVGEPHTYEMPVGFYEHDPKALAVHNGNIADSLWKAIAHNLSIRDKVRCTLAGCTKKCAAEPKPAECTVSVGNLVPKPVKVAITKVTYSGHPDCPTVSRDPLGDFEYDLHDTDFVRVGAVHSSSRFSFNAVPRTLLRKVLSTRRYCAESNLWYEASTLSLVVTDPQPEAAAPTIPVQCPVGNRWTRVYIDAEQIKCKSKHYTGKPCTFILDLHTGLDKEKAENQSTIARQLALQAIAQGNVQCYYRCGSDASGLAHFTQTLKVTHHFPNTHGTA